MICKRGAFFFVFIFLLSINIVNAIEFELSKSIYQPGETLQAEISGSILENIEHEDISFYSGRTKVPLVYDLAKINDRYYTYALLPYKERNYTIKVKGVFYKKQGTEIREDLILNFSIKSTKNYSLGFNPGFIITKNDFFIGLENKGKEDDINAVFEATDEKYEIQLGEEESEKILFLVSKIENYTESKIKITIKGQNYEIPVFIIPEDSRINITKKARLRFFPSSKNLTLKKDKLWVTKFTLSNLGDMDLKDIKLSIIDKDKDINALVSPKNISFLEANDEIKINLSFEAKEEDIFVFKIKAKTENLTAYTTFQLNSTPEKIENGENGKDDDFDDTRPGNEKKCGELNGQICGEDEICNAEETLAADGYCCLGECEKQGNSGGIGKWIGFVLFVVVIIILILVFRKIKKQKSSSEEILKKRAKIQGQKPLITREQKPSSPQEQKKLLKKK